MGCYTFLYARRSSDDNDHQTLSLDAQQKACSTFAEHRQQVVSEVIRESHSARRPGRPLFQQMLLQVADRVAHGQKVSILSHKPDRLLRNLADWAKLNDLIDAGVELVFVTGSYPNNAQGKMAFGVNVLFAKYYVDNLSEEVHKGINEKLARGEWPALAPLGYRNVKDKRARERVVLDADTAPFVRRAFEYYATGEYSLARLAAQLETDGLVSRTARRRLTLGYLHERILRNPFYCGLMRFRGELYPGVHPALVTLDLFEKVQERLRRPGPLRPKRHLFRYRGLFRCADCGAAIVGEIKKARYVYYRCNRRGGACRKHYIRQEELTYRLHGLIEERVQLGPELIEALRSQAIELQRSSDRTNTIEQSTLRKIVGEAERRLTALLDLRLSGNIDDEQFAGKREELLLAQRRAQESLRKIELPAADPQKAIEGFISFCNNVAEVFQRSNDDEVRQFLQTVGSNYQIGGREVSFEPVKPFGIAVQIGTHPQWRATEEDVSNIISALPQAEAQAAELSSRDAALGSDRRD